MKKEIIIIHCSDSDNKLHDDISVIDDWHKERGFLRKNIPENAVNKQDIHVGYQYFIKGNGSIQIGRDEVELSSACEGYNSRSINICLHGRHFFHEDQFRACKKLVLEIMARHGIELMSVVGHCKLNPKKSCPNFSTEEKIISDIFN